MNVFLPWLNKIKSNFNYASTKSNHFGYDGLKMKLGLQKKNLAGLDISSNSVKLLVLSKQQATYQVEIFDIEPLPKGAMIEKEIKDIQTVSEVIQKLLARSPIKIQEAAVAVADASVITKIIPVEKKLSEIEIEAQILLEAERHIPYPLEEIRFDFEILGDSTEKGYVDVLLAASRAETVDQYLHAVNRAGLNLKIVDVESYALLRACQLIIDHIPNKSPEHLQAVFDIGSTRSVFTVVKQQKPIFTRSDAFGGHRLCEQIAQSLMISMTEAENLLKQKNWVEKVDAQVLQNHLQDIVENLRRELQFFTSATHYDDVHHIILAGGASQIPGLSEKVTHVIKIPAVVANPFLMMSFSKFIEPKTLLQNAAAFMQTCGLALRSF